MKQCARPISIIAILLFSVSCYAKGHGGHGGGHHGGGGHGTVHSPGVSHGSGARQGGPAKAARLAARPSPVLAARSAASPIGTRRTYRTVILPGYSRNSVPVTTIYENYTPGFGPYYYGYGYGPYFNYSYYNMIWMGMGIGYTPNYGYYPPPVYNGYGSGYNNNYSNGSVDEENLDGYVVYARDTLRGRIALKANNIFLEKSDSGHNYDYKFKPSQKQLTTVRVYNEDNKQLDLVRLPGDHKKLWRVIHEGRLSIYDSRHDFIYRPDDIDIRSLVILYDGHSTYLDAYQPEDAKERLAGLVNAAYDTKLDPAKFGWNELLVYIDKLDQPAGQ